MLESYDVVLVSSSGGKDSQAMLDYVVHRCAALNMVDRIVVVHADLGDVEWEGTKEVAAAQAAHYGLPFAVVTRLGTVSDGDVRKGALPLYERGERRGDLLEQVVRRWRQLQADPEKKDTPPWPGRTGRWCTSDFKRGPIRAFVTELASAWQKKNAAKGWKRRPARILDCWGLRADESTSRRKRLEKLRASGQEIEAVRSTSTVRHDVWNPLAWWTAKDVWARIGTAGTVPHRAYSLGMPRLSCAFCVFAKRDALTIAAKHNPRLLQRYVDVERLTGSSFQPGVRLADVQASVAAGERIPDAAEDWNA